VSNLRKEFAKLKFEVEDKNKQIVDLEMKVAETEEHTPSVTVWRG
jgi:predicted  nucleic acid-binding Zn-ribbon protein